MVVMAGVGDLARTGEAGHMVSVLGSGHGCRKQGWPQQIPPAGITQPVQLDGAQFPGGSREGLPGGGPRRGGGAGGVEGA